MVERTGRDRDADLRRAIDSWSRELEKIITRGWYQWFTFEPLDEEATA